MSLDLYFTLSTGDPVILGAIGFCMVSRARSKSAMVFIAPVFTLHCHCSLGLAWTIYLELNPERQQSWSRDQCRGLYQAVYARPEGEQPRSSPCSADEQQWIQGPWDAAGEIVKDNKT